MKNIISVFAFLILTTLVLLRCSDDSIFENENPYDDVDQYLSYVDPTEQREGNAEDGKEYLLNGDYVSSGIPANLFRLVFPDGDNLLGRTEKNEDIPLDYTQVTHPNGIEVVSPNCMQCHSGFVDNNFVVGLANINADFTLNNGAIGSLVDLQIKGMYGEESLEYEAFESFGRAVNTTGEHLMTETVGAHRNSENLEWLDDAQYEIPEEVIPADVPAWWLLKKKNAMFSTGIGRGDFARIMMASSVLTLNDSTEARRIDEEFINVATYIRSIEAPTYPKAIDQEMADRGRTLFENTCSKCHGRYGDNESYPNVIVDHQILQTDSLLAKSNFAYKEFSSWYNSSWFSKGRYGGQIVPGNGYLAPPLDGIWATAPYLHNGSIPNLESLLDSSKRDRYWRRTPDNNSYDFEKTGISTKGLDNKQDKFTYDTTLPGYSNEGHYFSDFLSDMEKNYLLEYLKTL